ncbi:ABC transporter ATP-binding protein [Cytobacillus kochii]|uniref:ABC transporter ATP-binding protein n=1 Tax=Cytobacillus kochii TaxID=859143 RepID=UPI00384C7EF5
MSLLQLKSIEKRYSRNHVIKDISMTVNEGEFVSIIGPSGSGKSTLFNLIGGMMPPDNGVILLNGQPIINKKGSVSYMPQSSSLLPWRTVLHNVMLGQELSGEIGNKVQATKMLERAGLIHELEALPHELSGGMKQRVAFIRALLSPQPIILLDEPFAALDEFTRLSLQKWLLDIWEQNRKTIVFITHHIEEAIFLSDTIYVLSNKPTTVKEKLTVPFSRPRHEDIILSSELLSLKKRIKQLLE